MKIFYKGFNCLIEPRYEFQPSQIVYGKRDGDFYQNSLITDSLSKIGKYLNIRQHPIKARTLGDAGNSDVYLSQGLFIYKVQRYSLEDLVVEANPKVKTEMEKLKITSSSRRLIDSGRSQRQRLLHQERRQHLSTRLRLLEKEQLRQTEQTPARVHQNLREKAQPRRTPRSRLQQAAGPERRRAVRSEQNTRPQKLHHTAQVSRVLGPAADRQRVPRSGLRLPRSQPQVPWVPTY